MLSDRGNVIQIFMGDKERRATTARVAHVSEDPTVISHCPFCGSGGITGRSDGGADCDLCGRSFTVMEQPLYSNTPATGPSASVPVTPFDPLSQETPFDDGSAGSGMPGDAPGADPTGADQSGDQPDAGGGEVPSESGDDGGDEDDGKPAFLSSLRARNGTPLSVDDFLLHHAIRAGDRS